MANTTYNQMIRKFTVAFAELFSNITLVRYNPDGTEQERFIVPIAFANKEKYVMRLEGDPDLDKKVQITLPRMAYEMNGLKYDTSRKQNTNIKNFYSNGTTTSSQYMPVPYDFDFSLYIMVRNIEDGHQIIEHILPYFTPDYTIKLNMVPEMGVTKEVPIILKDTTFEIEDTGDRSSDTRTIIWTLNFTVKGFVFGAENSNVGLIRTSITNIFNDIASNQNVVFNLNAGGVGSFGVGEIVTQGSSSAVVVSWNSLVNQLVVTNINGRFVDSSPIVGSDNNGTWTFNSYNSVPNQYSQIVISPSPTDANAKSVYVVSTQITEQQFAPISSIIVPSDFVGDMSHEWGVDDLQYEVENNIDLLANTTIPINTLIDISGDMLTQNNSDDLSSEPESITDLSTNTPPTSI